MDNIKKTTADLNKDFGLDYLVPGLLVIDTPGHESFANLRSRGSGLCDIAILVVDIMHGLEPQTIESVELLRMRKTPFVVALNKVDRLYGWKSGKNRPIREALAEQDVGTMQEFDTRVKHVLVQLAEQRLNAKLYYENDDYRRQVSVIPTSAHTGEGIPDLLLLLVQLTQKMMTKNLMYHDEVECTVLEVKVVEGHGTTIDVVLVNGEITENDTIVVCGLNGPIVTQVRALLTPQPMKELRVKGEYVHHAKMRAAMGIKISAKGLEQAVAGTSLLVQGPDDDLEELKAAVMEDLDTVMSGIQTTGRGVNVQCSTLGAMEALMEFLRTSKIPVSGVALGPVHKKDVMRASVMLEHDPKYALILAFDVPVSADAKRIAAEMGVKIFTADIIYHLFDQFTAHMKEVEEKTREEVSGEAVFPCKLKIMPSCIFATRNPIVVGVNVLDGILKVGTPLCIPGKFMNYDDRDGNKIVMTLGRVTSIERDHKEVDLVKKGAEVAIKITPTASQSYLMCGRHFTADDELVSLISRKSIDLLKANFREDLGKDDWRLVIKLKKVFDII